MRRNCFLCNNNQDLGKLILLSNNGSLYHSKSEDSIYFASEEYALKQIGVKK